MRGSLKEAGGEVITFSSRSENTRLIIVLSASNSSCPQKKKKKAVLGRLVREVGGGGS